MQMRVCRKGSNTNILELRKADFEGKWDKAEGSWLEFNKAWQMHNAKGLMQSESNYITIILLCSIFFIIRIFLIFSLLQEQKPKLHIGKVLQETSCAKVLKMQGLQDLRFPSAKKSAGMRRSRHSSVRADVGGTVGKAAVCTCRFKCCQVCRQEQ